jgi:hypothetical protein
MALATLCTMAFAVLFQLVLMGRPRQIKEIPRTRCGFPSSRGLAPVAINAATLEATAIRRATTQVLRQLRSFTKSSVVRWDL